MCFEKEDNVTQILVCRRCCLSSIAEMCLLLLFLYCRDEPVVTYLPAIIRSIVSSHGGIPFAWNTILVLL
jgi:hypothetical protein